MCSRFISTCSSNNVFFQNLYCPVTHQTNYQVNLPSKGFLTTEVCLLSSKQPNKKPKQSNIVAGPFLAFFYLLSFIFQKGLAGQQAWGRPFQFSFLKVSTMDFGSYGLLWWSFQDMSPSMEVHHLHQFSMVPLFLLNSQQVLTSGYDLMMITLVTFYRSISTASWIHPWMCKTQWDTTRAVYRWGHSMSSWGYDTCNWITERLAITYYSLELTSKYADVVISGYIPRWYRNSLHTWNVANAIHPHSKAVALKTQEFVLQGSFSFWRFSGVDAEALCGNMWKKVPQPNLA